ncbi:hypothetical protein [Stackebrandtia nassauensis]|nr:hypothetical protein [Stackebrandtia nassauensis]
MRQLAKVTTGLLLIAALASCGGKGQPDDAGGSSSSSESSSSASSSDDKDKPDSTESTEGKPDTKAKTLTGTISDGVEPGCLMLKSDGVKYQLVGDATKKLKSGMKVEVTGKVSDNNMSTCMEGTVFEVDTVEKVS